VDSLIDEGYRVVIVDNLSTGKEENLNPKAIFYQMDISNPKLKEVFLKEKIKLVNHYAAQIDVRRSVTDPKEDARVNIEGLINILENSVCYRVKGIVFASSGEAIYGEPDDLPVRETHPKGPLSPYGVSKLSSEYYLYYYHRIHRLPYIALRYGNVYGPRQDPYGEAGVVAIFANKMLHGKTPTIFGDGRQIRDYVFVKDAVKANLLAMKILKEASSLASIDEQAYNIGTGIGTSVNEIFSKLRKIIDFQGSPSYGPERKGELRRISLDVSKAKKKLSWRPSIDLSDGLRRTVTFFWEMLT
jgi:UDP-glucose 4-epimerase